MPKYRLYVQEAYDVFYDIEADDEDDAWEAYYNGDVYESGREFASTIEGTEEILKMDEPKYAPKATQKMVWDGTLKQYKLAGGGDEEDII